MNDAKLAIFAARGRIAFGAAAVVVPGLAARVMGGRRGSEGLAPLFARMLGARDVVLGLGTVIALDRGARYEAGLKAPRSRTRMELHCLYRRSRRHGTSAFRAAASWGRIRNPGDIFVAAY